MRFRIVATDLDGTLLHSVYDVSAYTVEVLRRVQEAGARVVPVTARAPWSVSAVAAELGIRGYAVCNSGATTYDLDTGAIVEHELLDHAAAAGIVRALRDAVPGVCFACVWEDGYAREEAYVPGVPPPDGHPVVDDIARFLTTPVRKLLVKQPSLHPEELLARARPFLGDGMVCGTTGGAFVEVLAAGATKAGALARLCARLGVGAEEVVAFGDWPNDAPMLAWAGLGVAPANAHAAVLAVADDVCAPNDDDGVAAYLDRLLSEGRVGDPAGNA